MPVDWLHDNLKAPATPGAFVHAHGDAPALQLQLWPHRSLPRRGFAGFILLTCGLLTLPLMAALGTPVLWGLLPFFIVTVGGLWIALERSYRDGQLLEELCLWSDRIQLVRHNPRGPRQEWQANPYWVRLSLRGSGGPVENYLTLQGGGREVELGAFLSPDERQALHAALSRALGRLG